MARGVVMALELEELMQMWNEVVMIVVSRKSKLIQILHRALLPTFKLGRVEPYSIRARGNLIIAHGSAGPPLTMSLPY